MKTTIKTMCLCLTFFGMAFLAKAQNNDLTINPDTLWFEPMGDIQEFVITNGTANEVIIEDIIPEEMGFIIEGIDLSYTLPAGQSMTVTVDFMPAPGKNDYLNYDLRIMTSIGEYHVTAMLHKTMIDYGLVIVGSPYVYVEDENGAGGSLQNRYFGSQLPVEIYSVTEMGTDYLNIVPEWTLPYTLNPSDWFTFMFYAKNPVKERVITTAIVESSNGQREFVITISDELVSVTETNGENNMVYPNPGTSMLNIRTTLPNAHVEIYDLTGKMVCKQEITDNTTSINAENWTSGTYLWKVVANDKEAESGKWIKE